MNETFDIGLYMIDRDYRMLYINDAAKEMYPHVKEGDFCYQSLACSDRPCDACPIGKQESLFYNPLRREWISAQAAKMDIPGYGACYNIQFVLKERGVGSGRELLPENQVKKLIAEAGASQGKECIIGGYCEEGYPLFYINSRMVNMLGYSSREEAIRSVDGLVANFVHPDDRAQVRKDFLIANAPGKRFETTCRIRRKNGEWFWIVGKGKAVRTEDGRLAMIAICMDMTSIFRRQDALRMEYETLQQKESVADALMNNMPGGYHRCNVGEGFPLAFISDSFLKVVDWTREDLEAILDNQYLNMVAPEDREYFLSLAPVLLDEGKINCVYRIVRRDGGRRWIQDSTQYVVKGDQKYLQCAIADITDFVEGLNERQRKLEEAMQRIEAVSHAKSAFLFNVSHDVRTPMNAIQGYTHIIEQCPDDEEMVRDMVGKIKKSSDTLMQLLNDVLELSRIESGKDTLDQSTVNLNDFLGNLHLMFDQEMDEAGIRFLLENRIRDPHIRCDELKCTRVLMNMLSNAKKFTPAGGTVTLGAQQLETAEPGYGSYRFFVRDTGIGMSREFQNRAFEEFEREKSSTDSRINGSGLGMAIIRKLTDLMGGTCTLHSELGKGTEIAVTLTFPLEAAPEAEEPECACRRVDFAGHRVLLVEDNAFNREIARFILENMGLAVEEAEDGADALNRLLRAGRGGYDLVLMDIQMPVMDGYTATQEIRRLNDDALASIPIIAMTANAFKEDRDKCLEVGMNGHLSKPIDPDSLIAVLGQFF